MRQSYYSNGKLLLTGEYVVLDGALSLALPTSFGQSLDVSEYEPGQISWSSRDEKGDIWFETTFAITNLDSAQPGKDKIRNKLLDIFRVAKKLNPDCMKALRGYHMESTMDFPRQWGLGSSSTLVNNIAQWAGIDAYQLQWQTLGGSGYDIACAKHNYPVLYRLDDQVPVVEEINFNPTFRDALYFIYLNRKQDSRDAITHYRDRHFEKESAIKKISRITREIIRVTGLAEFEELLTRHESLLAGMLGIPCLKEERFDDFPGAIKSLGAWGGDFILATGETNVPEYFQSKGYSTVLTYQEMVL